jgi:hypothetical protein
MQVVRLFSPIKDDKQILKPQEMWEKDETWIWILIYKGKRRIFCLISYSNFFLNFIQFDMKLVSITMKMTLYLLRKQLSTVQYTWGSVKFPTTFTASCDSQSQIFGYNLRSLLKWYSVTYTSINTTVFKVRTVLCNNVKRLTLRSRFINRHKLWSCTTDYLFVRGI